MERQSIKHRKKLKLLAKKVDVQMIGDVRTFTSDNSFMIGEGCYGTSVFLGMEANGNAVAVKRILTSTTARSKSVDKELKLLKLLKSKRSEHIVHYREFKPGNPFSFLILDLCEETLADFVERNNKKYLETKGTMIIKEILTGLLELHSQRILHMDLKPQNILVNIDGHMLLSDFGISRKLKDDETTVRTDARGTLGWMAVESLTESRSKARFKKKSDIQVAGMVSFYVLTKGGHPFGDRHHRTSNIIDGKPVDLKKLTNETARRFVKWLIAHNTKDRPYVGEALQDVFLQSNTAEPSDQTSQCVDVSMTMSSNADEMMRLMENNNQDQTETFPATPPSLSGRNTPSIRGSIPSTPSNQRSTSPSVQGEMNANEQADCDVPSSSEQSTPAAKRVEVVPITTIENLPRQVYDEICRLLNYPLPDKDWLAMVGKMFYKTYKVRTFEGKENPTDAVLRDWGTERGNDLYRLVEILTDLGRDDVVDVIKAAM